MISCIILTTEVVLLMFVISNSLLNKCAHVLPIIESKYAMVESLKRLTQTDTNVNRETQAEFFFSKYIWDDKCKGWEFFAQKQISAPNFCQFASHKITSAKIKF